MQRTTAAYTVVGALILVHGAYRFGQGTRAEWQGTLVYAIAPEVVRRTRRGSVQLPVEAMAARAAWLVGELSQHNG
jgi:hypothetical protein